MPYKRASSYARTCSKCGGEIGEFEARIYEGRRVYHVGACVESTANPAVEQQIAYAPPSEADIDVDEMPTDPVYESDSQETEFPDGVDIEPDGSEPAEVVRAARPRRSHRKRTAVAV